MFKSQGSLLVNPQVGMLFIDFRDAQTHPRQRPRRTSRKFCRSRRKLAEPHVIPAKARTHFCPVGESASQWIPAFAGTTILLPPG
jgi:hypothetical protein